MPARRPDRLIPLLLFALVWCSIVAFGSWEWNPNNATRMFAAISLVEDGDATIDEFAELTIDKAKFGEHVYMDKAPGVTLMALPVLAGVQVTTDARSKLLPHVFGGEPLGDFLKLRTRLVVALVIAPLTAAAAVLVYQIALGMTANAAAALFAALGFAVGSPLWGWSTTLFGHAPVTALFVIAIWAVWRAGLDDTRHPTASYALAGAALGWAVVIEHPALLVGTPIGIWALYLAWKRPAHVRNRRIAAFAVAGIVAMLPLLAYNIVAYGTPFRLGYQGVVGFEGMQQGLFGLTYPKPDVLFAITLGLDRGMAWVAPVMLLAPFGIARLIRDPATRNIGWLAATGAVVAFLYNASYFYWHGGHSTGPRHALPALAFLVLGLAPFWAGLRHAAARWAAAMLVAAGIAINAIVASAEIFAPDLVERSVVELVWDHRFAPGYLRTLPSEYWGWGVWQGFQLWIGIASFLLALLILRARKVL